MNVGKLTVKNRTTVPRDVRKALGVKPGDDMVWAVRDGEVIVSKLDADAPGDASFELMLRQTMPEWFSVADDEAFGDL